MSLKFDTKELTDLMKNFYVLTGIRIVLFDKNYNEVFAYPYECSPFCQCMRKNSDFYKACCQSDKISFETCRKTGTLTMYKCHAGLIEATHPVLNNDSIIGYIMFGQVSDSKDKDNFKKVLLKTAETFLEKSEAEELVKKLKFKSQKQLIAASKILEACTSYILLKEIIKPSRSKLFSEIDKYISDHLDDDVSIPALCEKFNISRTRLYMIFNQYIDCGISAYIRTKRLTKAKELLTSTDMSVSEISNAVGFSDYNYFLKSFKKHFGISTKNMRKSSDYLWDN